MISSLLRPQKSNTNSIQRLFGWALPRDDDSNKQRSCDGHENSHSHNGDENDDINEMVEPHRLDMNSDEIHSDEDGDIEEEYAPLLPIFSAAHLDALPIYNITRDVRTLVEHRCETTLSWDQLRSPQVSQFLIKPLQLQLRSDHFSRAILYSLLANCLQFSKEGQANPGNAGVLRTRGLVSELLAVRLLKEFNNRELIDALSYDFDPIQGMDSAVTQTNIRKPVNSPNGGPRTNSARTSTLEVAIRAQAKRFLAHPLVVQHLQAIWAGSIVFHSAADSLHRMPIKPLPTHVRQYGATHSSTNETYPPGTNGDARVTGQMVRRSVSLYNPNDSSVCKLSRLRVPRYRQIFSTISYAVMLALFLAVLVRKSLTITSLEVLFWLWSAGFMLDEILGFSEQGFSLYIMSVWNAFDIGILLLFSIYYLLRLYGIMIADDQKQFVADMAYDTLAFTAVLLFPRLFSVLDHYRYFSQLLIAFRMMAQDLAAVLILIAITCSGFFVSFTLSFGKDEYDGASVAYALFQILMGFTPAAWEAWANYNILGKFILTLFLIICHFLVVTILITVLTNSFMTIAKNANEEHQFLFAVNVLSMVKSDALFSYIAPSNLIGWIISPLRYLVPFRQFVRINRSVIKLTHFPALLSIFLHERIWLSYFAWEPFETDDATGVQAMTSMQGFIVSSYDDQRGFTPSVRLREPSATTRYKDKALEEVFRRPYQNDTINQKFSRDVSRAGNAVDLWAKGVAENHTPPMQLSRSAVNESDVRRPQLHRSATSLAISPQKRSLSRSMPLEGNSISARSADLRQRTRLFEAGVITHNENLPSTNSSDSGDELMASNGNIVGRSGANNDSSSIFSSVAASGRPQPFLASSYIAGSNFLEPSGVAQPFDGTAQSSRFEEQQVRPRTQHNRQTSVNTVVFNPVGDNAGSSPPSRQDSPTRSQPLGPSANGFSARSAARLQAFRQPLKYSNQGRRHFEVMQPSTATRANLRWPPRGKDPSNSHISRRETSYDTLALDLASDIGDNRHIGMDGAIWSYGNIVPSSFSTQLDLAASMQTRRRRDRQQAAEESDTMGRMVLARMNGLERNFQQILNEVRGWRNETSRASRETGGRDEAHQPAHHQAFTRTSDKGCTG